MSSTEKNPYLNNININPYNPNTDIDLYQWYKEYIINDIYNKEYNYRFFKGVNGGISKEEINFITLFNSICNGNQIDPNNVNLLEWYNNN